MSGVMLTKNDMCRGYSHVQQAINAWVLHGLRGPIRLENPVEAGRSCGNTYVASWTRDDLERTTRFIKAQHLTLCMYRLLVTRSSGQRGGNLDLPGREKKRKAQLQKIAAVICRKDVESKRRQMFWNMLSYRPALLLGMQPPPRKRITSARDSVQRASPKRVKNTHVSPCGFPMISLGLFRNTLRLKFSFRRLPLRI